MFEKSHVVLKLAVHFPNQQVINHERQEENAVAREVK